LVFQSPENTLGAFVIHAREGDVLLVNIYNSLLYKKMKTTDDNKEVAIYEVKIAR
jgi:hypothetical protein